MPPLSTFTPAAEPLLEAVLRCGRRSVVVVGTAKNTGKTVTANALRAAAEARGLRCAVTSIGRDGETADALDARRKPAVRLEPGTIAALPRGLLPPAPALEVLGTGPDSALGELVFVRVRLPVLTEIGGPPRAHDMRAVVARLRAADADLTLVDGALDRIAPLAGGDDAVVIATGAAAGGTVATAAAAARDAVVRLSVPRFDGAVAAEPVVRISGALDAALVRRVLGERRGGTIVVGDPTRITVRGALLAALCDAVDVRCDQPLAIAACTTCSAGGTAALDPRALVAAVAAATGLPAFDVVARLAA